MTAGTRSGRVVRVVSAAALLALAGGGVVVGGSLPARTEVTGPTRAVAVAPPVATLVCPGPLVLPDRAGTGDSAFDPVPVEPVTRVAALSVGIGDGGAAPGVLSLLGTRETVGTLEPAGGGARAGVRDPATALVVRAEPVDGGAARISATTASIVTAGDLRGLAAASCQEPGSDLWLVGGSTALESSASLVIDNPGTTPADVSVEVFGPSGPVELAGGERHLVAPGAERVLVLPALAAEQRRIAVHVTTTGGSVSAHVQDSRLRGFTPAGTDLVVPGAAPAERQVVPGVHVAASDLSDEDQPVLRLLAPGDEATSARITLLGADGATDLPGADVVELAPGEVTDVPLGGLPAGAYTAVVDADAPVVASAMVLRAGAPGELDPTPTLERAWASSVEPGPGGIVTVPVGTDARADLTAVSDGDDPAEGGTVSGVLRARGQDGRVVGEEPVTLEAGRTVAIEAASLGEDVAGLELVPSDGAPGVRLAWAVVLTTSRDDGVLLSVLRPLADEPVTGAVQVAEQSRLGLD